MEEERENGWEKLHTVTVKNFTLNTFSLSFSLFYFPLRQIFLCQFYSYANTPEISISKIPTGSRIGRILFEGHRFSTWSCRALCTVYRDLLELSGDGFFPVLLNSWFWLLELDSILIRFTAQVIYEFWRIGVFWLLFDLLPLSCKCFWEGIYDCCAVL